MALIECPECGREVSDQAVACPHCGYPMRQVSGAEHQPRKREFEHEVRTVQRAAERWRALRLAAVGAGLAGLVLLVLGVPTAVTVVLLLVGVILYAYARIGAWLQND